MQTYVKWESVREARGKASEGGTLKDRRLWDFPDVAGLEGGLLGRGGEKKETAADEGGLSVKQALTNV